MAGSVATGTVREAPGMCNGRAGRRGTYRGARALVRFTIQVRSIEQHHYQPPAAQNVDRSPEARVAQRPKENVAVGMAKGKAVVWGFYGRQ